LPPCIRGRLPSSAPIPRANAGHIRTPTRRINAQSACCWGLYRPGDQSKACNTPLFHQIKSHTSRPHLYFNTVAQNTGAFEKRIQGKNCLENVKINGSCACLGIAERQIGIRESRTIKNAELALGDPRKAFRATVSTSLCLENMTSVEPPPSPVIFTTSADLSVRGDSNDGVDNPPSSHRV
jgi:hypothetical protein